MAPVAISNGHRAAAGQNGAAGSPAAQQATSVHPTAARSVDGGLIKVQEGQGTKYDEARGEIRSVHIDRANEVSSRSF